MALLLAQSRRGQAFYRAAFYAPSLIGASVSVGFVWRALFSDDAIVDRTQTFFGVDVGGWIGDPDWSSTAWWRSPSGSSARPWSSSWPGSSRSRASCTRPPRWTAPGRFARFWNITLPMISPVLFFNVLLETIHSFQIFGSAYVVSDAHAADRPTPRSSTPVTSTRRASRTAQMGFASAMAWMLLLAVALVTAVLFWSQKRWVHYEEGAR